MLGLAVLENRTKDAIGFLPQLLLSGQFKLATKFSVTPDVCFKSALQDLTDCFVFAQFFILR